MSRTTLAIGVAAVMAAATVRAESKPEIGPHEGKLAPEIVGKDAHGKPLKLSDYYGKVVVVGFWGDWCGPCRSLYPHEREMVKKYHGQPFALVGVNSDDVDQLRTAIEREGMTWKSFAAGQGGGEIARAWGVSGWPTLVVIDHQGVVRKRIVGAVPHELEAAVAELIKKVPRRDSQLAN